MTHFFPFPDFPAIPCPIISNPETFTHPCTKPTKYPDFIDRVVCLLFEREQNGY